MKFKFIGSYRRHRYLHSVAMFYIVFFTPFLVAQTILVNSKTTYGINNGTRRGLVILQNSDELIEKVVKTEKVFKADVSFSKGIVPYKIDSESCDDIITARIHEAMATIASSSCVVFENVLDNDIHENSSWVHITNPLGERECQHEPEIHADGEIVITIGFDCMGPVDLIHILLHAIGFKDEITHPHRDQYVNVMWENIQPRYRSLFRLLPEDKTRKMVEYDPSSIMHFHDRAYSFNGGLTIAPRLPGLVIGLSEKLSQLDVMKLHLWFGHECNKRKIGTLLDHCKAVLNNDSTSPQANSTENGNDEYYYYEGDGITEEKSSDDDYGYDSNYSDKSIEKISTDDDDGSDESGYYFEIDDNKKPVVVIVNTEENEDDESDDNINDNNNQTDEDGWVANDSKNPVDVIVNIGKNETDKPDGNKNDNVVDEEEDVSLDVNSTKTEVDMTVTIENESNNGSLVYIPNNYQVDDNISTDNNDDTNIKSDGYENTHDDFEYDWTYPNRTTSMMITSYDENIVKDDIDKSSNDTDSDDNIIRDDIDENIFNELESDWTLSNSTSFSDDENTTLKY